MHRDRSETLLWNRLPIPMASLAAVQSYGPAIPLLQAALAENPSYRDALIELAQCRLALQEPQEAIGPLRKAIALQPEDPEAHFILGSALGKTGQTIEAEKERALAQRYRSASAQ